MRFGLCYDAGAMIEETSSTGQRKRVVIAMSGGVDSSVAAMLLADAGHEVIGLMMRLWSEPDCPDSANRCCTPQSVDDARRVAALLDIPFYMIDAEREFKSTVVDYFVDEYARGRTPNPCVVCNRSIRFSMLLQRARVLGANYLATGHYARVRHDAAGYHLLKGVDPNKDQSYVLHVLGQSQLARLCFPLGEMTKPQVRALARARGLPVAEKAESQDICFLASADYRPFVAANAQAPVLPGPICDQAGKVIGEHRGLAYYTVGQRHGLGLATGMPLYVTRIDAATNTLLVGPTDALLHRHLSVSAVTYVTGDAPSEAFACQVRLRYKAREAPATVTPLGGGRADIVFAEPQRPVSPGQAAVFYSGDEVLGGGTID
jgi:tRNA-specific 2-thiouridylase